MQQEIPFAQGDENYKPLFKNLFKNIIIHPGKGTCPRTCINACTHHNTPYNCSLPIESFLADQALFHSILKLLMLI